MKKRREREEEKRNAERRTKFKNMKDYKISSSYNSASSGGLGLELGLAKVVLLSKKVLSGLADITKFSGSHLRRLRLKGLRGIRKKERIY